MMLIVHTTRLFIIVALSGAIGAAIENSAWWWVALGVLALAAHLWLHIKEIRDEDN